MATCRARFARGEQACVRCAEGKLDVGDVEDLDDEDNLDEDDDIDDDNDINDENNLDEDDDIDDDDDTDNDDDLDDLVGYTSQPDGRFGAIAYPIELNGHRVTGFRVTVTEDGWDNEYVIVVEDGLDGGIPSSVRNDINSEVDRYVWSWASLYDVLADITGRAIKLK